MHTPSHRVSVCLSLGPCSPPPPPPQRMHCFGKATFLNVCYLCTFFLHKGGPLNDVRGSHKFHGVSNLA